MTHRYDQFSLCLGTRGIINELSDLELDGHKDEIIKAFGGLREILKLCLAKPENITLFQHQKLFQATNDIFKKTHDTPPKAPILSVSNNSISTIFTYLNATDHANLQETCRQLAITGRHRASYLIDIDTNKYVHFGEHLRHIHSLGPVIEAIRSNDSQRQLQAIQGNMKIDSRQDKSILQSGILPDIINIATKKTNYWKSLYATWKFLFKTDLNKHCLDFLDVLIYNITETECKERDMYRYTADLSYLDLSVMQLSKLVYPKYGRWSRDKLYYTHPTKQDIMRQKLVDSYILSYLSKNLHQFNESLGYYRFPLDIILNIMKHESFDSNKPDNTLSLQRILDHVLLGAGRTRFPSKSCRSQMLEIIAFIHQETDINVDLDDSSIMERIINITSQSDDPGLILKIDRNLLFNDKVVNIFAKKKKSGVSLTGIIGDKSRNITAIFEINDPYDSSDGD